MKYKNRLIEARLIKRYKRFLADVELDNGKIITVHTPNTGSMTGCSEPGSRIWIRDSENSARKYRFSWEITESIPGILTGVNTHLANDLVAEKIASGEIQQLPNDGKLTREVIYGKENSRIDILIETNGAKNCYIEVKNVTMATGDTALFPDAVSKRGSKHLRELMGIRDGGHRGIIFFCIQRNDVKRFRPAVSIDPEYSKLLVQACQQGVEAFAFKADISPQEIRLSKQVPVILD